MAQYPCHLLIALAIFRQDVAIAYGYNNIPTRMPASIKPLPLNELTDLLRLAVASTSTCFVYIPLQ